ncbi:polysaccharide pyruvyl transferase CsaB [Heliorestis acidaminivorans]|uniref:polysaccharide pyruvyl transferase CsaB n=1 Tax=Heliorestis acidaminivorans TaxID=553427 RepID=UPI0014794EA8|nr:polysaccharide pyruvyl transferase CsaB [Heliorestis acidaminivorans]
MATVVLSGYYGYDNAGDEALLKAMITALRRLRPNLKIIVLSGQPAVTRRDHGVEAVHRYNPLAVLKVLLEADLVISGGGSLLQDVTGPMTIPYYLLVVYLAHLLGRKVMFYAQGIGPVNGQLGQNLIRHVANHVDLITLRDKASAQRLREMGVHKPPIHVTVDPVFALVELDKQEPQGLNNCCPKHHDNLIGQNKENATSTLEAVFCLRRWDGMGIEKASFELAQHLLKQGWTITFLPMHAGEDVELGQEMERKLNHPRAKALSRDLHFEQAMTIIGRSSLLVGVRLHALIFATLRGVPVIGISYDPKVTEFLEDSGRPAFGATAPLTGLDLIEETNRILKEYEKETHHFRTWAQKMKSKAEQTATLAISLMEKKKTKNK